MINFTGHIWLRNSILLCIIVDSSMEKKLMFCTLLYVSLPTLDKMKSFSFQKQCYKGNESFLLLLTKAVGLI